MNNLCTTESSVMPGIYAIRCVANGGVYIGSTRNSLNQRFREHKRLLSLGRHFSRHMQASWNKYGAMTFTFGKVENCDADEAYASEQFYLDTIKPAFNNSLVAVFNPVKVRHRKMSEIHSDSINQIIQALVFCGCLDQFIAFCRVHTAAKFFGLETKAISADVRRRMSEGAKLKHSMRDKSRPGRGGLGIPKTQEHRNAQSEARIRYVARMRELGQWPPQFYSKN